MFLCGTPSGCPAVRTLMNQKLLRVAQADGVACTVSFHIGSTRRGARVLKVQNPLSSTHMTFHFFMSFQKSVQFSNLIMSVCYFQKLKVAPFERKLSALS